MSLNNYQIPPVANWQMFENLCRDIWAREWGDIYTQKNGRIGQPQNGVDVYGKCNNQLHAVQCKGKDNTYNTNGVTLKELKEEVEKANNFTPSISHFILATTAPNDATIQQHARELSKNYDFNIEVVGWDYILNLLSKYPEIIKDYYPHFNYNIQISTNKNIILVNYWYEKFFFNKGELGFYYNTSFLPNYAYNVGFNVNFINLIISFSNSFSAITCHFKEDEIDNKLFIMFETLNKLIYDLNNFINKTVNFNIANEMSHKFNLNYILFYVNEGNYSYHQLGHYIDYKKNIFRSIMYHLVKISNTIIYYTNFTYNTNFDHQYWAQDPEQNNKELPYFENFEIFYDDIDSIARYIYDQIANCSFEFISEITPSSSQDAF
ncbi:hypothetical protein [Acinetobacter indicus]|uniref:hypothetical protein n=1 Tax=Acinetobacter indicus TaxID=756892 RepID=UPI0025753CAC|nr:hypothetical protein [Acinetobacter indicus]MDM1492026.1 hypothetical protein [Acinetobacter indicus]